MFFLFTMLYVVYEDNSIEDVSAEESHPLLTKNKEDYKEKEKKHCMCNKWIYEYNL